MAETNTEMSVDDFINDQDVLDCLKKLKSRFGEKGEKLIVSDVIDMDGHQYVNLVQKGGGVLGTALVGYTYILEQMNIRFIRLAGTSAGAINTALMTIIGGSSETVNKDGGTEKIVKGDKQKAKSEEILKIICDLNFFDLVDGHPAARWIIKEFIKQKDFSGTVNKLITRILITLVALPVLDFICLGLQHQYPAVSFLTKLLFVLTGFFIMLVSLLVVYLVFLFTRLKDSGFGINPGDFFYDWIKLRMGDNDVHTVSDLISKASTPVPGLKLRVENEEGIKGLDGDVTFIASELVTENKIEFPKMWKLFRTEIDMLQPAGFVRASMSIPIFFESYFIDEIPCTTEQIKKEWAGLDEPDPPSVTRFVDGGILSNFPINLFYNPDVDIPRLPAFGIDLDDKKAPEKEPEKEIGKVTEIGNADKAEGGDESTANDQGKHAEDWSLTGYIYRLFGTVRSYYDKDFLIKNSFFKKGIGVIPLKGFGWLNFFLDNNAKKEMFILGAQAATKFLEDFDWEEYKTSRLKMQKDLMEKPTPVLADNK